MKSPVLPWEWVVIVASGLKIRLLSEYALAFDFSSVLNCHGKCSLMELYI